MDDQIPGDAGQVKINDPQAKILAMPEHPDANL
jgi:hypothetical protein